MQAAGDVALYLQMMGDCFTVTEGRKACLEFVWVYCLVLHRDGLLSLEERTFHQEGQSGASPSQLPELPVRHPRCCLSPNFPGVQPVAVARPTTCAMPCQGNVETTRQENERL